MQATSFQESLLAQFAKKLHVNIMVSSYLAICPWNLYIFGYFPYHKEIPTLRGK